MKKLLLFTALAACGMSAMGADFTPNTIDNFFGQKISSNGRYLTSYFYGDLAVYDIETGKIVFSNDIDTDGELSRGNGNSVADNGTVVGSSATDMMLIIHNGKVVVPEWAQDKLGGFGGITPDATMICGSIYTQGYTSHPYVFPLDANGNVGDPIALPHPEKDMVGTKPQQTNANYISADGKIVAGNMKDDSGSFTIPIVYTKGDDGKWSYSFPSGKLFNPQGIELPPYYGDLPEPVWVNIQDYMSDQARAAYNQAMDQWASTGYQEELYPKPEEYMTPEQIEAYNAAVDKYNAEAAVYNEAMNKWFDAMDEIAATSVSFLYNSVCLSHNGKYLAATAQVPGEDFYSPDIYTVYVFNLEDGTYEALTSTYTNLAVVDVMDDGTVISASPLPTMFNPIPQAAYVYDQTKKDYVSYADYFASKGHTAIADWLNEKFLAKNVEVGYDPETWDPIYGDLPATGFPFTTPDGSVMGAATNTPYILPGYEDLDYLTYYFTDLTTGIDNVAVDAADITVKGLKGGVLLINGEVATINVYDLSGRQVYAADAVDGTINTGLPTGLYVVKATASNGAAVTAKVIF